MYSSSARVFSFLLRRGEVGEEGAGLRHCGWAWPPGVHARSRRVCPTSPRQTVLPRDPLTGERGGEEPGGGAFERQRRGSRRLTWTRRLCCRVQITVLEGYAFDLKPVLRATKRTETQAKNSKPIACSSPSVPATIQHTPMLIVSGSLVASLLTKSNSL